MIAMACDDCPEGVVQYTDIKKFYSSISIDFANTAWQKYSGIGNLPTRFRQLGDMLIEGQSAVEREDQNGILTGPMFSHLLANLVLRELDEKCTNDLPVRYFRYVDDITLVGEKSAVKNSHKILHEYMNELGFELHDNSSSKNIKVSTSHWLEGRNDFTDRSRSNSWRSLIGDLKRFLLKNASNREEIKNAFRGEGFRLPILDYSGAARESSFLKRAQEVIYEFPFFRGEYRNVTISSLLKKAIELRKEYREEIILLIDEAVHFRGYDRKRCIPKLRYLAARLIYLASDDTLSSLSEGTQEFQELYFHTEVMRAVSSGDVDSILSMGTNAAQAVAQPVRAIGKRVTFNAHQLSDTEKQSLSILVMNDISIELKQLNRIEESELLSFARKGANLNLMNSDDAFIREISCLHGISEYPRHPNILDTVFDKDEELALDTINMMQYSL